MKTFVKTLKIIGNVILWLFVAFAVLVTVLVFSAQSNRDGLASIGGKSMVTIVTDSMKPTFKSGDLIFDKILTNQEKISCQPGDIITYYIDLNGDGNEEFNTHRIVDVYEKDGYTYYITKGDNTETNPVNDANPVVSNKVVGKYTNSKLSSAGTIISFLQTSKGFLCVIVIPLVIFFLFELYHFVVAVTQSRVKKTVSAEEEEEIKKRAIEEYLKQQGVSAPADALSDEPTAETTDTVVKT